VAEAVIVVVMVVVVVVVVVVFPSGSPDLNSCRSDSSV